MDKTKILLPLNPVKAETPWLWIGTWSMGGEGFGPHDEGESLRVLHRAVDHNLRHFDTAGFYAHGKSETLLQKIIAKERDEFFISSKGGLVWEGRKVQHRGSPDQLRLQLEESLSRLKTGYLDLFQLHWPDPDVPIDQSLAALKEFQQQGLIRYWGVSNLTPHQVDEYLREERNIPHQVHFNPLHKDFDTLSAGMKSCINCITSPLEQGLLGYGKSSHGTEGISRKDLRNRNPYFSDRDVLQWTAVLDELIKGQAISKILPVLLWICSHRYVHAIIPGPRTVRQLDEIIEFKSVIEEKGFLSSQERTLLSNKKVKEFIGEKVWEHLNTRKDL
jgi:aryl-alcohol dehydrogenase-like predicted oxidoreductase